MASCISRWSSSPLVLSEKWVSLLLCLLVEPPVYTAIKPLFTVFLAPLVIFLTLCYPRPYHPAVTGSGMFYGLIACAIAAICFLVASWASTGVRLFVRIYLGNGPFFDDYLAVVSLVCILSIIRQYLTVRQLLFTVTSIISVYCHFKGYIPLAIMGSTIVRSIVCLCYRRCLLCSM